MGIGQNVQRLRKRRGLTFDAVAKAVGTDPQTISQMEKRNAKNSTFAPQLAKLFGVDLIDLLSNDFDIDAPGRGQSVQQAEGSNEAVHSGKIEVTTFADRFSEARKAAGFTQEYLANLCGLTKGAISQYELGHNSVAGENVFKLADALHVSARWLMTGAGSVTSLNDEPVPAGRVDRIAKHLAGLPDERLDALGVVLGIKL